MRATLNMNIISQPSLVMEIKFTSRMRLQLEPERQFISNPTIAGRRLEIHQSIRRNKNKCDYWLLRGSSSSELG